MPIQFLCAGLLLLSGLLTVRAEAQSPAVTRPTASHSPTESDPTASASPTPDPEAPARFFARMQQLCNRAFEGKVVQSQPGDALWHASRVVLHVHSCQPERISMALHVGKDRSRSWLLSFSKGQLRLEHVHRQNGTPATLSGYGGQHEQASSGPSSQTFPVDVASMALFRKHNLPAAADSKWQLTFLEPGQLVYRFSRPGREFQLQFDLNQPVPPPAP